MPGNDEVGARGPAPEQGQHSAEILTELGYTDGEVEALAAGGVVPRYDPPPSDDDVDGG